jgi:ATP-binding cassette subfamily C (CFTR/MRP) protein 1
MTSRWSEAKVSLKRLNKFLRLKELNDIDQDDVQHHHFNDGVEGVNAQDGKGDDTAAEIMIKIDGGVFEWEAPEDVDDADKEKKAASNNTNATELGFRLHDVDFEVRRGELVAIVGRVGSGKTSLLNGILGEMKHVAGRLRRYASSTSYVSQRCDIASLLLLPVSSNALAS